MKKISALSIILTLSLLFLFQAKSAIPEKISYQGIATNVTNVPLTGTHTLRITLYNSDGDQLWQESFNNTPFDNGLFNIILGNNVSNPLPSFSVPVFVGVKIDSGDELYPWQPFTSSPYSFISKTVVDSAITTSKLANGSVTANKIADFAVTNIKIATSAVEGSKGAGHIATGTIGNTDIGTGEIYGSNNQGASNNIAQYSIAGSGTGGSDINPGSIGALEIAANSITSNKLADQSVVKSLNNIQDNVNLTAGSNITITPSASSHSITISASGGTTFTGILNNLSLIINNGSGSPKITLNPDGSSLFSGLATIGGGLHLTGTGNGLTFPDGTILTTATGNTFNGILNNTQLIIKNNLGNPTITMNPDGTSSLNGLATFANGIQITGSGKGVTFPDGTLLTTATASYFNGTLSNIPLIIYNASNNPRISLHPDGTSTQLGLATFAGGIQISGLGNGILFPDGSSFTTANGLSFSQLTGTNNSNLLIQGTLSPTGTGTITANRFSGILPVANGGTNSASALSNNRIMVSSGGAIVEGSPLADGQVYIGSSGNAPQAAFITGSSNRIIVTNGAGSITLLTPQDIATTSSPTFSALTITNKATSASTVNGDAAATLTTKDYVDSKTSGVWSSPIITFASAPSLTNNRILSQGSGITITNAGIDDGSLTVEVNFAGSGIASSASRSDHSHTGMLTGNAANNQLAVYNGTNTLTGGSNLTWNGSDLSITGNLITTGTTYLTGLVTFGNGILISGTGHGITFPDGTFLSTATGSSFGGILTNIPLLIKNSGGTTKISLNPDGTSTHAGLATFNSGISIAGSGNGITFPDGTLLTSATSASMNGTLDNIPLIILNSTGDTVIRLKPNGTSYFKDQAIFDYGLNVRNGLLQFPDGTAQVTAGLSPELVQGHIYVGNAINVAADVTMTGDVSISYTGKTTIVSGAINSDKILDGAVAPIDLQAGSANQLLVTNSSGNVGWSSSVPGRLRLSTSSASTPTIVSNSSSSIIYYTGSSTLSFSDLPTGSEGEVLYIVFQTGQTTGFSSRVVSSGGTLEFVYVNSGWHLLN
jgi:hypothetical protein